jgi:hypothetical protein
MKPQDFLKLSDSEQQASISESGYLFINFLQGDTVIHFYKVKELFVKIITKNGGYRQVEVNSTLPVLTLSEA